MIFTILGMLAIIAGIGGVIALLVWIFADPQGHTRRKYLKWVGVFIVLFLIGLITSQSVLSIATGHRGVVLLWGGEVEKKVMGEGLNFKIPFAESVVEINVQVQAHAFKDIDAASKEMQSVKMTGNINWHFNPSYVYSTYQQIGASNVFVDKVLDSALKDFLKEVTPKYGVSDILSRRSDIRAGAVEALNANLARYFIIIDDIYIADIQFSPEYLAAIERQQVAERQINTETNILETKKIQATQAKVEAEGKANAVAAQADGEKRAAITRAEGNKQAAIINSEGQASAITTVADAQAKANETLNKSLTDKIIQYTTVQKLADDIKVVVLPSGQQFILGPEILGK